MDKPSAGLPAQSSAEHGAIAGDPDLMSREETAAPAPHPPESAAPSPATDVKPRVVFAPPKEVVQPLPAATQPAPEN